MIYGLGFPNGASGGKVPQIVGSCMGITPYTNSSNSTTTIT